MYDTSRGRGIQSMFIKNLSYNGTHGNTAVFVGCDEERALAMSRFIVWL
jgi:hypothetical protein